MCALCGHSGVAALSLITSCISSYIRCKKAESSCKRLQMPVQSFLQVLPSLLTDARREAGFFILLLYYALAKCK